MIDRRKFKGLSIFLVFQNLIEMELTEIEDYINEISSDLKMKQEKLEKDYEEANKEVEENSEYDVHSFFEDDIHKYFKVFPVYTYNSLLLALYGQFENWLKKLCDLDNQKGFTKVEVKDLHGKNYIEKSSRYLKIVAGLDLECLQLEWQKITEVQKIRNCIAHNNSNIVKETSKPIEKQELYSILSNDHRIKFDKNSGNFYIKEKKFLLDTIVIIRKFLTEIIVKLDSRKVVAKNTAMPYDNASWGQEKAETLLKQVIASLNLIDKYETRTDIFRDSDLKENLKSTFESMAFDLTKLYSFFSNGKWEVVDQKYIVEERENGLNIIKDIYGVK